MSVTSTQNLAARRQDLFERARGSLTTLSAMSGAAAFLAVAFLYLRGTATGPQLEQDVLSLLLGLVVAVLAAMCGAAAVGAVAMRALRDAAALEADA